MIPFSQQVKLDESEIQFLRDNKASEYGRIVKKLVHSLYEEFEHAWLKVPSHSPNDLLVLKGEKLALLAVHNTLTFHSQEPLKEPEKINPLRPVR